MAVTYSTAVKTLRMQAVADAIDAGASAGTLEIGTAAMGTVLATFALVEPCGTVSGAVLTLDFDPDISDTSADATGTAAAAQIKNGSGTVVISGLTVGTSGTDIVLDNTSITAGQTVTLTAGTLTHA
ncbi:hypothetical protein [Aromatoleum anaerobium]|uniref:Uncharacterized protein n=1 Tax=Aromatoleum anaerobium TaxID=182180 RepID=A0ABX1PPV2_9RHOO|nr:hypothetical protein [Aromatoleum anaerobium]MCK0507927.1 hypothetical protein [Aromatoleum anaerobium]